MAFKCEACGRCWYHPEDRCDCPPDAPSRTAQLEMEVDRRRAEAVTLRKDAALGAAVRAVLPVHASGQESTAELCEHLAAIEMHEAHLRTARLYRAIAEALRKET